VAGRYFVESGWLVGLFDQDEKILAWAKKVLIPTG